MIKLNIGNSCVGKGQGKDHPSEKQRKGSFLEIVMLLGDLFEELFGQPEVFFFLLGSMLNGLIS